MLEHRSTSMTDIAFTSFPDDLATLTSWVGEQLPEGEYRKIFLKPNWVLHEKSPNFPIAALVTSTTLIEAVLDACLDKYAGVESIMVGDVPLQSCDWEQLHHQAGLARLEEKYGDKVVFRDLRREKVEEIDGYYKAVSDSTHGDPSGYAEVVLDEQSLLDPISNQAEQFRVSDYDPEEIVSSHRKSYHRYQVARSILEADLFINLPKMKTHQKAGLTGALKNLVGINSGKKYLVHHRLGKPKQGGDEFPPDNNPLVALQIRIRERLQGGNAALWKFARFFWTLAKKLTGLKTEGTAENLERKNFYVAAGSWYGNDTIWRMIYDLNRIILYGRSDQPKLAEEPQRRYLAFLDAGLSGEGNGPLQPIPVETGLVGCSDNPFFIDMAMAQFMGFDRKKIPQLSNYGLFGETPWSNRDPDGLSVRFKDETLTGISALPVLKPFRPSPGWVGHIEQDQV
ncbi:MAG: DUF362 domain-containing protein [Verrucomicrobiota bacterium]